MPEPVRALPLGWIAAATADTKPAGGAAHPKNLHDFKAKLLNTSASSAMPPKLDLKPHLRSSFAGGGMTPRSSSSLPSPRYMNATNASTAKAKQPAPAAEPVDVSDMDPAGGSSNDAMKTEIDFEVEARRPFRNSPSVPRRNVPATTQSIAAPTRGATLESPRDLAHKRLLEGGMFDGAGLGGGGGSAGTIRPASAVKAAGYTTTHDKSLPNARKSKRGMGWCQPGPQLSAYELAGPAPGSELISDAGLASRVIARRGRGSASPMVPRPFSDPNALGADGASGSGVDMMIGGRKARGMFSARTRESQIVWG